MCEKISTIKLLVSMSTYLNSKDCTLLTFAKTSKERHIRVVTETVKAPVDNPFTAIIRKILQIVL